MYLIYIFICISIISAIIIRSTTKKKYFVKEFISSLFGIGVVFIFVSGIWYFIEQDSNKYYTLEYNDIQIQSAFTDKVFELDGAFILGIGSVHGSTSSDYIVYGQFDKGLKRLELNPSDYFVREDNTKPPCVENYNIRKIYNPYKSKWVIFSRKTVRNGDWGKNYGYYGTSPVLVVPTNTVRKEYSLE
jgi:hypothetical protein